MSLSPNPIRLNKGGKQREREGGSKP